MTVIDTILQKRFGYSEFRPGQREVIEQIIEGKDVLALLPTGMGKSLCYQLPAYILEGAVLIISPLLSLMQDQVEQMKVFGEKWVIAINSFLQRSEKKMALQNLHHYRFIFLSPEMLARKEMQTRIESLNLSLIVVDEAHCISQWGFDFRPDYLKIGELFQREKRPPILALTATATEQVKEDIKAYLKMKEPFEYIHSVDRSNIHYATLEFTFRDEKIDWIVEHVLKTEGPGIVYTQSRDKTEKIASLLIDEGIRAASYHGGKDMEDRQFIQQQFLLDDLEWIVATNAFGMGVNKPNIRQIIHETIPSSIEHYVQEVGRAGRDGDDALAILLYAKEDENNAIYIASEDIPTTEQIKMYDYLRNEQLPVEQMRQEGHISETGFRVLHHWMNEIPIQDVEKLFSSMKHNKMQAVFQVANLIHSKECIRDSIVQFFGQKVLKKPGNCCTRCGLKIEKFVENRQIPPEIENVQQHWEDRLQKLLLM